jgi:hypothetical protein
MVIFGCASHDDLHGLYRVKTEAPVSTPIHAKPAWLGAPGACEPALPQFALPGLKKHLAAIGPGYRLDC